MKKVSIVFWSGTGNTEIMANKIAEGVKSAGNEVDIFTPADYSADMVANYDVVVLGCPSMGAEELEDGEFAPMYEGIKSALAGKSVALFGSYGWGDGEWLRTWQDDVEGAGATVVCESLMINETPDADGEASCVDFGKSL